MKKIANFFFIMLLAVIGGVIIGVIHRFVPDRFRVVADVVLLFVVFSPNIVSVVLKRKKGRERGKFEARGQ